MIRALSIDVGGTLATGRSLTRDLTAVAPVPGETVAHVVRTRLHPASVITEEVIGTVGRELGLAPATVRHLVCGQGDVRVDPAARAALTRLREAFPEMRLCLNSNVCAAASLQVDTVTNAVGDLVERYYKSYETGAVKGLHHEAFTQIATQHRLNISEIIHIDDKPDEAVAALAAGCRALLVTPSPGTVAQYPPAARDRFRHAATLDQAVDLLLEWIPEIDDQDPRLPVRAAGLITDFDGNILITRGPDDDVYHLPGGRCHPYRRRETVVAAFLREIQEELGTTLHATPSDVVNVAWSENETRRDGAHKIVLTVRVRVDRSSLTITPKPDEITDYRWCPRDQVADLLASAEHWRLQAIDRGETYTAVQNESTLDATPGWPPMSGTCGPERRRPPHWEERGGHDG